MSTTSDNTTSTLEFASEAECAARLQNMWTDGDIHPHWPADSREVAELLRSGGGYDVTVELLETWARSKQVPGVKLRNGRFEWIPSNVMLAVTLANVTRRWIPLHPKHIHRMSGAEVASAQAAKVGETIFEDLDEVDCRSLLGLIASQHGNDIEFRSMLVTAVLTKLRQAGIE